MKRLIRFHRFHRYHGFTLMEVLIGLVMIAILGGMTCAVLQGGMFNFARNFSLNQSGQQSRMAMALVTRRLEEAATDPELVNLQTTPEALVMPTNGDKFDLGSPVYAQGVRFHRYTGGPYRIAGPLGSTDRSGLQYVSGTSTTVNLEFKDPASASETATSVPQVGDRLLFINPALVETVGTGSSPGSNKPGRVITAVSGVTTAKTAFDSILGDVTVRKVTVTLASAPGAGKDILINNSCYTVREAAFLVYDANGLRELRYIPSTSNFAMSNKATYKMISRDLDPSPTEKDSLGNVITAPFWLNKADSRNRVSLDLPIRVRDYENTLKRAKATNEFNSYLRTQSQVILKNR